MIHLAHSRVCHLPKGISIGSSVFARHTGTLDSQARTQTKWRHDVRNRPLSMLYMWCWLKKLRTAFGDNRRRRGQQCRWDRRSIFVDSPRKPRMFFRHRRLLRPLRWLGGRHAGQTSDHAQYFHASPKQQDWSPKTITRLSGRCVRVVFVASIIKHDAKRVPKRTHKNVLSSMRTIFSWAK